MMSPLTSLRQGGLLLWRRLEHALDAMTGSALNPLRHLGSLGFLCFWLLAISGIYLYTVLDTSAEGAYPSIKQLGAQPWWVGGWLRSVHRYAADAFVLVMMAHLMREWLHGRYRGFRRFSWLTGIPLIVLVFVGAIGGFWLNWDRLGQFSAVATAEWVDALPLLAAPMARNFLTNEAVSDRLFSLLVFIHLGVPLLTVFALWFHIQRITMAAVFPPRRVAGFMVAMLVTLALAWPVTQHPPADLSSVPTELSLDWILLFVHPLTYASSPGAVWLMVAGSLLLLLAMPWLPRRAVAVAAGATSEPVAGRPAQPRLATAPPVAVVDPDNCNGCRRCFADCPYAAVTMVPHPNQKIGKELARVNPDLCASCGICAGACPSSTPFRSAAELVTGIDMPQLSIQELRRRLKQGLEARPGGRTIVVFGCDEGCSVQGLTADDVLPISLLCAGMLPPSFVDYALRDGAAGVLVTGCREGDCEYRLGQRWAAERLSGQREPRLRGSVPAQRLEVVWASRFDDRTLHEAIALLRARLGDTTCKPLDQAHHD